MCGFVGICKKKNKLSDQDIEDINSISNKLPRVLEKYGGIEVEPLYEIPGPFDSGLDAAQYLGNTIFMYYHLDNIISISDFTDYYFSQNPDTYESDE